MDPFSSMGGGSGQGGNGIRTGKRDVKTGPDGKIIVVDNLFSEAEVNGVLESFEAQRFLCQGCGKVWLVPGENAYSLNGKILCARCYKRQWWIDLFRPFWSLFYNPQA